MLTQLSAGIIVFVIRQDSSSGQVCKGGRTDSTREIRCRVTCPDQLLLALRQFDVNKAAQRREGTEPEEFVDAHNTRKHTVHVRVQRHLGTHMGLAASG